MDTPPFSFAGPFELLFPVRSSYENKGIEGTVTVTQRPHLHEGDAAGCSECVVKLCAVSALLFGAGGYLQHSSLPGTSGVNRRAQEKALIRETSLQLAADVEGAASPTNIATERQQFLAGR